MARRGGASLLSELWAVSVSLAAVFTPLFLTLIAVVWRGATRLRDNTEAVRILSGKIDGTVTAVGLEKRVSDIENWRIATEAKRRR